MLDLLMCAALCVHLAAPAAPRRTTDPYQAYQQQDYEASLQGFLAAQLERPRDPELLMNIGSAHDKLHQYELAEKAFRGAAISPEPHARAQALYNLGNTAFHQGRMDEAINQYQAALSLDPNDRDARANLAYVRQQKQQRQKQAQQREQQQREQQQRGEQQQQQHQQQHDQPPPKDQAPRHDPQGRKGPEPPKSTAHSGPPPADDAPPRGQKETPSDAERDKQQAARLLDSLNETRPKRRADAVAPPRDGKDW